MQPMTDLDNVTVMGKITSVYGVKGWVKVLSYTRPKENLCHYREWFLQQGNTSRKVEVSECKPHSNGLVAKIVGLDDREKARELGNVLIAVATSELPELEEGEYYWHQLVGMKVSTESGQLLGQISRMMETGANDVMVVRACQGSLDGKERLIPYLEAQVVKSIDPDNRSMIVDWDPDF